MRNISFALTTKQFLAGSKDVTRRLGWEFLQDGEILCAVEKGMGLKPGEKIKRLGVIRVISARRQLLSEMLEPGDYGRNECIREGFPRLSPQQFVEFFCRSHKGCRPTSIVTRIEFSREGLPPARSGSC